MTKKSKQKNFRLSPENFDRGEDLRHRLGIKDNQIYGVGVSALEAEHRKYRADVENEIKQRMINYTKSHAFDEEAEGKGQKVTCEKCGYVFYTQLKGPRQLSCPECGWFHELPGPTTQPTTQLKYNATGGDLRRSNAMRRDREADEIRRRNYGDVDRDHAEAMKKMTEGSFKFEKKKRR